jgi:hypothetical protein
LSDARAIDSVAQIDKGWYRGQCRYSSLAPSWDEFMRLLELIRSGIIQPIGWRSATARVPATFSFISAMTRANASLMIGWLNLIWRTHSSTS